ncbi:CLSTN2 [Cervus elaphus hippelaphus]|uniref:CLSTN2 n=1 Tax=Cervus elaphus hippelaphus TaxID=46360 RepID=A0A212CIU5_CEREH|nr:CLSTN2 [Cervus elaphus hippelaphus]
MVLLYLLGGEVTKPRFAQFFHGSLASLTIRPGKMDSQKVISCLQACKEGLDINSLESLGQGIKYHFNPSQSVLVMEGDDIGNINRALQKVSYINSRQFPTAGVRRLKVSSKVQPSPAFWNPRFTPWALLVSQSWGSFQKPSVILSGNFRVNVFL